MFDVWKNVLAEVEQTIPREQYSTWFTGTELVDVNEGIVTIGVPNVFKIKQLQVKYSDILKKAFKNNNIEVGELKYIVQSNAKPKVRSREIPVKPVAPEKVASVARARAVREVAGSRLV